MNQFSTFHIMTGERFQMMCDSFIGAYIEDFLFNPNIGINNKNILITNIQHSFNNDKIIFCYGHRLKDLFDKLDYFQTPFILISGNSDTNIINDNIYLQIANHHKVLKWYAQNLSIDHPKIKLLPIGLANSQWQHGNIDEFVKLMCNLPKKSNDIYFQFNIQTNTAKRTECFNALQNILSFLEPLSAVENWKRLATYKFCVCPEGNGFDSHRIWECYYLRVVPIVKRNDFIDILKKQINIPLVILDDWNDIQNISIQYNDYVFEDNIFNIQL